MRLPFVIAGQRIDNTNGQHVELTSRAGPIMHIPYLDVATTEQLTNEPADRLLDVPLHEIVAFLHNVGHNWKSPEYSRRRLYERYLCQCFGYSKTMAETEANWIAFLLSSHYRLYDSLAAELGAWQLLDQWMPREEAWVRAFPHGKVLHIVPGNVPLSSIMSIVRAIITKNVSIVKASSEDPLTPIALALSFADIDREHPVTKALSVVHWEGGKDEAHHRHLVQNANAVCAWGGEDAIAWARRHASPRAELLSFGPRRSIAVIGRGADPKEAARALAHDVAMYDQRACFSVRHVYIEGSVTPYLAEIEAAFTLYDRILPRGVHSSDERACSSLARQQSLFLGAELLGSNGANWSVIVAPSHELQIHPLGRTLYVHSVSDAAEVGRYIGEDVQTVAVFPHALGLRLRDDCGRRGVARVVELGLNNVFRVGGAHDGIYPLQRLVRMVSMEQPSAMHVKGLAVRVDQTTFLEEGRFQEFIP